MSYYLFYSFLICQLIIFLNSEPLIGENVYPVSPHEFPFIASLSVKYQNSWKHFCTGSLITKKHILTAAHCLELYEISEVNVIISHENTRNSATKYDVYYWITYNNWANKKKRIVEFQTNDIGIVKLSTTVKSMAPGHLTKLIDQHLQRTNAVILGWKSYGTREHVLHKAKVTIMQTQKCEERLKLVSNLPMTVGENILCTSADPYVLTSCGDSGGPLLDMNNRIVGIIRGTCPNEQWGEFSSDFINQYMVNLHPSVNYYRDFIEDITKINTNE